ncbi:MAG: uracil-DNA glycosylase [Armatimonadetes bacterium]|nr:uracil-DNA glycosylase [Armatimonadota bacterium]
MDLNSRIISCEKCPRLRGWCEKVAVEKRASFQDQDYWGKPVPNFGDPEADLLILGLAPAAHGANRTGRMFTGDQSGLWLFRALHRAGLASQAESVALGDGLILHGVMITAVCHCAPPDNKPTPDEIANCRPFLAETIQSRNWKAILCLGSIAWDQLHRTLEVKPKNIFAHGAQFEHHGTRVLGCYHPSQQNTFTGRLTQPMLDSLVQQFLSSR